MFLLHCLKEAYHQLDHQGCCDGWDFLSDIWRDSYDVCGDCEQQQNYSSVNKQSHLFQKDNLLKFAYNNFYNQLQWLITMFSLLNNEY